MKSLKYFLLLALCLSFCTSCARQISSDVYASRQVGEVSTTYAGYIRSVREVSMQQGEQLEENGMGVAGGGILGGALGNSMGRGNFLPTAVGAIAGAVTGSLIEKKLKQQSAYEYIVELENKGLVTIVQGTDQFFLIGQPVYVIVSQSGRSRIIPATT